MKSKQELNRSMTIHFELIEQCRRGNSKAQFEIYSLYSKAMYNVASRILPDSMEAEDAMQDAFFKAFDKIGSFRNDVTFGAWLKRIVVNTCIDYLKKRKFDLVQIDDIHGAEEPRDFFDDDATPRSIDEVKSLIEQLPHGYKIVLNLHLVEEYDYPDIAEMLGTTQSNVRSQYARAKQKLIEMLKQNHTKSAVL